MQVASSTDRRQVLEPIVQGVTTFVVDDHAGRYGTIRQLPDDDGARSPHVRFCNLDPRSPVVASVGASPNSDRPDWDAVVCSLFSTELGSRGPALTFGRWAKVPGASGTASVRAVVHRSAFGRSSMEQDPADRARQVRDYSRPTKCGPVSPSARMGAEQQPALVPGQTVRAHPHGGAAAATRSFDHATEYTGSGTPLAVALEVDEPATDGAA